MSGEIVTKATFIVVDTLFFFQMFPGGLNASSRAALMEKLARVDQTSASIAVSSEQ